MSHTISKAQLRNHIVNAHNELAVFAEEHPEIKPMLRTMIKKGDALLKAARDERIKSEAARTTAKEVGHRSADSTNTSVVLKIVNGTLQVLNLTHAHLNFPKVKAKINEINGNKSAKVYDAPGKSYHGQPIYRSCFDKTIKGQVLDASKLDAVLQLLKEEGAEVHLVTVS